MHILEVQRRERRPVTPVPALQWLGGAGGRGGGGRACLPQLPLELPEAEATATDSYPSPGQASPRFLCLFPIRVE